MTILWTGAAGALAIGVLLGIGKMWRDAQHWKDDRLRDKAPWERAMRDFKVKEGPRA